MNKRVLALLLALIMLTGVLPSLAEDEILVFPDEEAAECIPEDMIVTEESLPQHEGEGIDIGAAYDTSASGEAGLELDFALPTDDETEMIQADIPDAAQSGMADPVSVKLNKKKATCFVGVTLQLKATVKPAAADPTVTWQSSNKKVAKVSKTGLVTPLKAGKATITVKTKNKKTYSCTITVKANKIDKLSAKPTAKKIKAVKNKWTLYPKSLSYISGGKLRAELYLLNGTSKASSDIKNMTLRVKANGKVIAEHTFKKVKVKAKKNSFATFKVTFPAKSLKVSPIKLKKYKASKYKFSVAKGLTMTAGKAIGYKAVNVKYFTADKQAILEKARKEMPGDITAITAKYTDKNGYVPVEQTSAAIAEVADYLKQAESDGKITYYEVDEYGAFYVDAAKNEGWLWEPPIEGLLSSTGTVNGEIITLDGFGFAKGLLGFYKTWGQKVKDTFDCYNEPEYGKVNPETFDLLTKNQFVIIITHGGHKAGHSFLMTDMRYSDSIANNYKMAIYNGTTGVMENSKPELIHGISTPNEPNSDYLCITSYYIKNRCGDLSNSLVYLGCCHGVESNDLAQAFLDHGATAVVGFDKPVVDKYVHNILNGIIDNMCATDSTTGKHYTLGQALEMAKATYGAADSQYNKSEGAEAKIKGGAAAEAFTFAYGTIQGTVAQNSAKKAPIEGAAVRFVGKGVDLSVTTDSSGAYAVKVPAGKYSITVKNAGYTDVTSAAEVTGDEKKTVDIAMDPNSELTGTVNAEDDGGLAGATITCTAADGTKTTAETDASGHYVVALFPGAYTVTASIEGYEEQTADVTIRADTGEVINFTLKKMPAFGDYITFGHYEQDNNTDNGKEPIEWIVLESDGKTAKLLSRYALDGKPYNTKWTDVTWETCTLRTWLNSDFLNDAFTTEEQGQLETVTVTADPNPLTLMEDANPSYLTDPGNDTRDKVFLLSILEAERYFDSNDDRICYPTAYAKAQGVFYSDWYHLWFWWLRSPGCYADRAAVVKASNGCVDYYGINNHFGTLSGNNNVPPAVRPVVVLRLS